MLPFFSGQTARSSAWHSQGDVSTGFSSAFFEETMANTRMTQNVYNFHVSWGRNIISKIRESKQNGIERSNAYPCCGWPIIDLYSLSNPPLLHKSISTSNFE
jgi:hypothetical protein